MRTMRCSPPDAGRRPLSSALMHGVPVDRGHAGGAVQDEAAGEIVALQEGAVRDEQSSAGFERVEAGGAGAERGGQAGGGHDVSWLAGGGSAGEPRGETADVAGCRGDRLPAEQADLVVLGGDPGQRQRPELLEVADGRVAVSEFLPELVVACFELGYLGVSRVGGGSALAERGERRSNSSFRCG